MNEIFYTFLKRRLFASIGEKTEGHDSKLDKRTAREKVAILRSTF